MIVSNLTLDGNMSNAFWLLGVLRNIVLSEGNRRLEETQYLKDFMGSLE